MFVPASEQRRIIMLFVVTHEHAPELCPADDPAPVHKMADENHIRESGVKGVGADVAPKGPSNWERMARSPFDRLRTNGRQRSRLGPRPTGGARGLQSRGSPFDKL